MAKDKKYLKNNKYGKHKKIPIDKYKVKPPSAPIIPIIKKPLPSKTNWPHNWTEESISKAHDFWLPTLLGTSDTEINTHWLPAPEPSLDDQPISRPSGTRVIYCPNQTCNTEYCYAESGFVGWNQVDGGGCWNDTDCYWICREKIDGCDSWVGTIGPDGVRYYHPNEVGNCQHGGNAPFAYNSCGQDDVSGNPLDDNTWALSMTKYSSSDCSWWSCTCAYNNDYTPYGTGTGDTYNYCTVEDDEQFDNQYTDATHDDPHCRYCADPNACNYGNTQGEGYIDFDSGDEAWMEAGGPAHCYTETSNNSDGWISQHCVPNGDLCDYEKCKGCMSIYALNFNPDATIHDEGRCIWGEGINSQSNRFRINYKWDSKTNFRGSRLKQTDFFDQTNVPEECLDPDDGSQPGEGAPDYCWEIFNC